jgi:hypothetical protein
MDTELTPSAEVDSAPAPEVTAPSEVAEQKPEVAEQTFTQAQLDEIISKRLAREQRKWERERRAQQTEASAPMPKENLSADQFETPEAYTEVLVQRKAEELIAARDQQQRQSEALEAYHDREETARDKYADFEQVVYNPKLPITNAMAETIQASDVGPDLAYYLGSNPQEATRISRLSPILQAKEIGKIEAKLLDNPPVKKTTSAPAPISPVTAKAAGNPSYDTTDPRSLKSMSTSEWIEAERQRQIKKWEAQQKLR